MSNSSSDHWGTVRNIDRIYGQESYFRVLPRKVRAQLYTLVGVDICWGCGEPVPAKSILEVKIKHGCGCETARGFCTICRSTKFEKKTQEHMGIPPSKFDKPEEDMLMLLGADHTRDCN